MLGGSFPAATVHVALIAGCALCLVRSQRSRWLPLLSVGATAACWWWWVRSGMTTDGPQWLAAVVSGIYTGGTVLGCLASQTIRSPSLHFVVTILAGVVSFFASGLLGMAVWVLVAAVT